MSHPRTRWEGLTAEELGERWGRAQVHVFARISSSNDAAKELAAAGAPAGTVILADEQTAGRGVESRRWHSPAGAGLYLSLVLRPERLVNPLLLPILAGLGVARALRGLVSTGSRVGIKWPNDLIVGDRKVGGVLSEASWAASSLNYVILGIGINVRQKRGDFPKDLRDLAISLAMVTDQTPSRLELADAVLAEVEERCSEPPASLDREDLRELDELDWLRDRRCTVQVPGSDPVRGVASGIAPDGALLFRPDRGALERVTAGRVVADDLPLPDY